MGAVVAVVAAATVALPGCTGSSAGRPPKNAGATAPRAVAFQLYTHCGIDEARVGSSYYEAIHPLLAGGNPPAGWANPYQPGTMTMDPPNHAIFTDDKGHRVVFRLRPGATGFKHICS